MTELRFSSRFKSSQISTIEKMIISALEHFPEHQDMELRVGLTKTAAGKARKSAILLNPDMLNYFTIGHELMHLSQDKRLAPHGEVQCDVWTLARAELFLDEMPTYLVREIGYTIQRQMNKQPYTQKDAYELIKDAYLVMAETFVIRHYLNKSWQEHAQAFREYCITATEEKKTIGRGYLQYLRNRLEDYVSAWWNEKKQEIGAEKHDKIVEGVKLVYELQAARSAIKQYHRLLEDSSCGMSKKDIIGGLKKQKDLHAEIMIGIIAHPYVTVSTHVTPIIMD